MQPKGKLDPYRYSIACKIQKLLGTIDEIIADALHNLLGNLKIFLWSIDQLFNSLLEAFNELWSIIKDLE